MKHSCLQIIRDEHASLAAMLQSMRLMVQRGTAGQAQNFFEVMRAMLFYIDEFPERLHHPKESNLLFPRVARLAPQTMDTSVKLEKDHARGETAAGLAARGALVVEGSDSAARERALAVLQSSCSKPMQGAVDGAGRIARGVPVRPK